MESHHTYKYYIRKRYQIKKKKLVYYTNIKMRMYKKKKVQRYVNQSPPSKDSKRLKDGRIC
jgi:hypothetical protein